MRHGGKNLLIHDKFEVAKNASGDFNITKYIDQEDQNKAAIEGHKASENSLMI